MVLCCLHMYVVKEMSFMSFLSSESIKCVYVTLLDEINVRGIPQK